jgi:hypothetical protein
MISCHHCHFDPCGFALSDGVWDLRSRRVDQRDQSQEAQPSLREIRWFCTKRKVFCVSRFHFVVAEAQDAFAHFGKVETSRVAHVQHFGGHDLGVVFVEDVTAALKDHFGSSLHHNQTAIALYIVHAELNPQHIKLSWILFLTDLVLGRRTERDFDQFGVEIFEVRPQKVERLHELEYRTFGGISTDLSLQDGLPFFARHELGSVAQSCTSYQIPET